MSWDKFDTERDPDAQFAGRFSVDAIAYAIGVFVLPFFAIHSLSDFQRLWWLFLPAVILSVATHLTVRRLKKSSYVKKPLNLSDSD